jgi:pimeloyl-ACP methyl ester carboxylesterase
MWKFISLKPIAALVTGALIANTLLVIPDGICRADAVLKKELNFVFLHGMGGSSAALQLLSDKINELAPDYISQFEKANPQTTVSINMLLRSYPNTVDIISWSNNIADDVEKHFGSKGNLILVGHSMGGKSALYAAVHDPYLSKITSMVVTINSPIKNLDFYHVAGGGSVTDYLRISRAIDDKGVAESLSSYDSSDDGLQVGQYKHWLAFVSSEPAPLSPLYDFSGLDAFPEDMDDGLVPISAQYATGADTVYYGEHGHSDFGINASVAKIVANNILQYIFGSAFKISAPISDGLFEHYAGWLPSTYHWNDRLGESVIVIGTISHVNTSLIKWQEWEDVVSGYSAGTIAGTYEIRLTSFPLLSQVKQTYWLNPADARDARLYIRTRAAPGSQVSLQWRIYKYKPLPPEIIRDHYEIKVTDGTSLVGVTDASWLTDNSTDLRINARSEAEGPFHWYKAEFKVFYQQTVLRKLIDNIPYIVPAEQQQVNTGT